MYGQRKVIQEKASSEFGYARQIESRGDVHFTLCNFSLNTVYIFRMA